MIRTTHLSALAVAALLAACASAPRTHSDSYVRDTSAPAGTSTYTTKGTSAAPAAATPAMDVAPSTTTGTSSPPDPEPEPTEIGNQTQRRLQP